MKYFFAECLADNSKLRRIQIYDTNADKIVERLKEQNSGFGSHFKDFLKPQKDPGFSWTKLSPMELFQ